MTEPYWYETPSALIKVSGPMDLFPTKIKTPQEKYNAMTRLIIVLSILMSFISESKTPVYTGGLVALGMYVFNNLPRKEGMALKQKVRTQDFVDQRNPSSVVPLVKEYEFLTRFITNPRENGSFRFTKSQPKKKQHIFGTRSILDKKDDYDDLLDDGAFVTKYALVNKSGRRFKPGKKFMADNHIGTSPANANFLYIDE